MAREGQVSAGGLYGLRYHIVCCPKYRRPEDSPSHVVNQLKGCTSRVLRQEYPSPRSRLPTLRSFTVATVAMVSAAAVRRYVDTRYERRWRKGRVR